MRVAVDLDGTLCELKAPGQGYGDVRPLPGAVERLRELRRAGHTVIITTARNMATCEGNVGKAVKNVGRVTLDWLESHGVEYDEFHFGKPNADIYIDDRALRFERWDELTPGLIERMGKPR